MPIEHNAPWKDIVDNFRLYLTKYIEYVYPFFGLASLISFIGLVISGLTEQGNILMWVGFLVFFSSIFIYLVYAKERLRRQSKIPNNGNMTPL